jgi:carbonic anhydrase
MSDQVWNRLVEAHARAVVPETAAVPAHRPVAAILACSDARVPPSVVFDQPAGSLFVVRIAGNTAGDAALASLDYAVDQLGVDLLVVLGHTGCGAVGAAASGACSGDLAPIVEPICRIARTRPDADVDEIVRLNVAATVEALERHRGPVGVAARSGRLDLRGAVHDLASGRLETVSIDPKHLPSTVEAS